MHGETLIGDSDCSGKGSGIDTHTRLLTLRIYDFYSWELASNDC
jgi:hypothetical protein